MKKVYKYGTGHDIPEGAIYLSTQVETTTITDTSSNHFTSAVTKNTLVWHYFLVEVEDERSS